MTTANPARSTDGGSRPGVSSPSSSSYPAVGSKYENNTATNSASPQPVPSSANGSRVKKRPSFLPSRSSRAVSGTATASDQQAANGGAVTNRRRPLFPACVMCFRATPQTASNDSILISQKSGEEFDDSQNGAAGRAVSDAQPGSPSSSTIASILTQAQEYSGGQSSDQTRVPWRRNQPGATGSRNSMDSSEGGRHGDPSRPHGVLSPSTAGGSSVVAAQRPGQRGTAGTPDRMDSTLLMNGPFLGPQLSDDLGKKTLVLDLDETLVHSCFRPVSIAAFIIPVEIDGFVHNIYVCKRPGVDQFLSAVSRRYEVVIFTASLRKYADPLIDRLDPKGNGKWRLFREACTIRNQNYIKDLSKLGRPLKSTIIIDNSPHSYCLQPDNAIPIGSWFDNMNDRELLDLIPILDALAEVEDIPAVMRETLTEAGAGDDAFLL